MGKHERAAPLWGDALSPFSMIGTICLEVKTGAPYLKFRPVIRQQLGYGAPVGVRRPGGTGIQPVHYGSWPWGSKFPLAALVLFARPPCWRSLGAPAARLPALCPEPPLFSCGEDQLLSYTKDTKHRNSDWLTYNFSNIFSCSPSHAPRPAGQRFHPRPLPAQPHNNSCLR